MASFLCRVIQILFFSANPSSNAFQIVSTEVAWTGLGFASDLFMVGSDAVIGLPDESAVLEYDLITQVRKGCTTSSFRYC